MLKKTAAYIWRNFGFKKAYQNYSFKKLLFEWHKVSTKKITLTPNEHRTILIIPSDPLLLDSSTGDSAMISAIMSECRKKYEDVTFIFATNSQIADDRAMLLGAKSCRVIDKNISLEDALKKIVTHHISHVITIGADVLDGSYDPCFSGRSLILTDLLAQIGAKCTITGFSVSEKPYLGLKLIFDNMHPSIWINLRDPISFERFKKISSAKSRLVADIAFLLEPEFESANLKKITEWINVQKQSGNKVIGVNIHPLLLELNEQNQINDLVKYFAQSIANIKLKEKISIVLIEHDFRSTAADEHCLKPLESLLKPKFGDELFKSDIKFSAREIKGLTKLIDGVIAGRMHLMIACLGVNTPTFGIQYKGKMEGLFILLDIDRNFISTAKEIMKTPENFEVKVSTFIDQIDNERINIQNNIHKVKELALLNISSL